jgi:hypothetical protein
VDWTRMSSRATTTAPQGDTCRAAAVRRINRAGAPCGGQAVVERSERLVAAWDAKPARGVGGTSDIVSYARKTGVPVVVLWPEGATRE